MTQWLLSYPKGSEERELVFRHHFTLLKDDFYVESVAFQEDASFWQVTVRFRLGYYRPDRTELKCLDVQFPECHRRSVFDRILADDDDF